MKPLMFVGVGAVATSILFAPSILHKADEGVADPAQIAEAPHATLLFVGDIMLDRGVARFARREGTGQLFKEVQDIFAEHDIVVGNLEGTLTSRPSVAEASSTILRFTAQPEMAEVLGRAGFTAMSLANNHALDFGEFGLDDTRHYLGEAGLSPFGSPYNGAQAIKATVNDVTVCLVGYHELFYRNPESVVNKLNEVENECGYTVLFAHWGVEYVHEPSASQRELAHLFVESGADLVVGAHPHVVQPVEIYRNTAIFYSLGNFVFDQGVRQDTQRGAMVSVELGEDEERFTVIPVTTYLEATVADERVAEAVLAELGLNTSVFVLAK